MYSVKLVRKAAVFFDKLWIWWILVKHVYLGSRSRKVAVQPIDCNHWSYFNIGQYWQQCTKCGGNRERKTSVPSDVLEITRLRRIRARTHRAKAKVKAISQTPGSLDISFLGSEGNFSDNYIDMVLMYFSRSVPASVWNNSTHFNSVSVYKSGHLSGNMNVDIFMWKDNKLRRISYSCSITPSVGEPLQITNHITYVIALEISRPRIKPSFSIYRLRDFLSPCYIRNHQTSTPPSCSWEVSISIASVW